MTKPLKHDKSPWLGLVSDLHCGSQYALVPPSFRPVGGSSVMPAASFMDYTWTAWVDFCRRCPDLDLLIVNGDLIEGENPSKRDTMDAITDNFLTQGKMAEEALSLLLPKCKRWFLVRGTAYHDGKHFETIEAVARNMGAEQWSENRYTGYVLEADWNGLSINATHHQTMGAIYPGTLASRTTLMAAAAERLGKIVPADLIVRSHVHFKFIGQSYGKWFISTPAWKLVTPYAIKRMEQMRASLLSDLGAILVRKDDANSITFKEFVYEPYKAAVREL
jgi:hypothetical protein